MKAAASDEESGVAGSSEPTPLRSHGPSGPGRGAPARRPPGASREDLDQAIALLRARIEEEFRISERIDGKSRQAFALAAGFFVVAQAVAFGSFAQDLVTGAERAVVAILAVVSGLAVAWTAHRHAGGEELQHEEDVRPDRVVDWCNEASDDEYVTVRIVSNLRDIAKSRAANNKIRERNYAAVTTAMRWALIFTAVELAWAVLVRI